MFKKSNILFMTCETGLHAGSGDSLGIVDLPIQRERHTSYPKIEASSLKGALREAFEGATNPTDSFVKKAFGPEESASEHAGALGFTDAKLLFFPVKSLKGVFAWVTCPRVLLQFSKDLNLTNGIGIEGALAVKDNQALLLSQHSNLAIRDKIVLEEYTFQQTNQSLSIEGADLPKWIANKLYGNNPSLGYWKDKIEKDIVVLSDNDFKDFVNLSTEVVTRIKIDNSTGTVADGALFTEEYLPAESILYSTILASTEFISDSKSRTPASAESILNYFSNQLIQLPVIQLGGNATLGKGLLRLSLLSDTI